MKKHKIAVVGLGQRGLGWVTHILDREDAELVAVCDVYEDRVQDMVNLAKEHGKDHLIKYRVTDYHELLGKEDIEIVLLIVSWEKHVDASVDFMNAGIITALEVGGAYSIQDCYRLVEAYERTKTPFFFMENCCYGKREMMVLNMVRQGVLGQIVHCDGAYAHDLREEIASGEEIRHYRLRNYRMRNCDNYPTHELGPIARVLNINHGNRMVSLVSRSSKAAGLAHYIKETRPQETNLEFQQGDIVNTIITCAGGETILLTLDTTLPRSYSRGFTVRGTKGMYFEDNDSIYLHEDHYPKYDFDWKPLWGNAEQYEEKYLDDIWKAEHSTGHEGVFGHGGMDELMMNDFLKCIEEGRPMPIDVYDAATWMAISVLTEVSIQKGGMPVEIPDFTNGRWLL